MHGPTRRRQASLLTRPRPLALSLSVAVAEPPPASAAPSDMLPRDVQILRPNPTAASNSITTSMYTWYTFPTVRER